MGLQDVSAKTMKILIVTGQGRMALDTFLSFLNVVSSPNLFLSLSFSNHNKMSFMEYSLEQALTQTVLSNHHNVPLR